MRRFVWLLVAIALLENCALHRPTATPAGDAGPTAWLIPLETPNTDLLCVQTVQSPDRLCVRVGDLRAWIVTLKRGGPLRPAQAHPAGNAGCPGLRRVWPERPFYGL